MKTLPIILVVLLTLILTVPVAGIGPEEWKEYPWKEGKCSLLLPGPPTAMKDRLQLVHKAGVYLVHYHDRPDLAKAEEKKRGQLVREALDKMRDSMVESLKGKLLSEKAITLGEHPGRELEIESKTLGVYRMRMYQVGLRFYQLIVVGPREVTRSKDAEKFIGSLKVTK